MSRAEWMHGARWGVKTASIAVGGCVLAAVLGATGAAHAASLSGPSLAPAAQEATFTGTGYAPNGMVAVVVLRPDGLQSRSDLLVAANGSLSYRMVPSMAGVHRITVLDRSGQTLAQTNFVAGP